MRACAHVSLEVAGGLWLSCKSAQTDTPADFTWFHLNVIKKQRQKLTEKLHASMLAKPIFPHWCCTEQPFPKLSFSLCRRDSEKPVFNWNADTPMGRTGRDPRGAASLSLTIYSWITEEFRSHFHNNPQLWPAGNAA